jgi:zeaxanthin glucosyltransferase
MSTIAVFLDLDEGHSLPIFRLLRRLKERGHRVCCLGLKHTEACAREQGFEFIPIIENVLPPEALRGERFRASYVKDGLRDMYFGPLVRGEVLDHLMDDLKPDVGIFHTQYYLESLVARYRYRLPIVYFVASMRTASRTQASAVIIETLMNLKSGAAEMLELLTSAGVSFKSLTDVAQLVLQAPELMVLPEAFDLPGMAKEPGVYYLGAGVDLERAEDPFDWEGTNLDQPLVYCALGSQNHLTRETSRKFFQTVGSTAATRSDLQFIISIGKTFRATDFDDVPGNVRLINWVPQLEVLSRASLMINHGGFGTVKECILMGVPMLVFPLLPERDMDACAERVVYHGLGLQGDIQRISPVELGSMMEQVIQDPSYMQRVKIMREKFKEQDVLEVGVEVIENVIAGSLQTSQVEVV